MFDDDNFYNNDDINLLFMKNVKKINKILSKINKCNYIGFFGTDDGEFHEIYEYNEYIMFDFSAILIEDKLKVIKLEIFGNLCELKKYLK